MPRRGKGSNRRKERMVHMAFKMDEAKFRELLLYVCQKSCNDAGFGAVKLNKLLFVVDFIAYGQLGRPATGMEYVAREHGPAPYRLIPIRDDMIGRRELALEELPCGCHTQKRLVALRSPNLESFKASEIALIDNLIDTFKTFNATEIKGWSHKLSAYEMADPDEIIPYETVFLSDRSLTTIEAAHMRELAQDHSWNVV